MKIIRHGSFPEKNTLTCEDCNCVFKYYNSEIDVNMTTPDEESFFGGFGISKSIKCPECKHINIISCDFTKTESWVDKLCNWFSKIRKENENARTTKK